MKKEYSDDGSALLSKSLTEAINDRLERSEQVIILQNRRGYSRVQQCQECGEPVYALTKAGAVSRLRVHMKTH